MLNKDRLAPCFYASLAFVFIFLAHIVVSGSARAQDGGGFLPLPSPIGGDSGQSITRKKKPEISAPDIDNPSLPGSAGPDAFEIPSAEQADPLAWGDEPVSAPTPAIEAPQQPDQPIQNPMAAAEPSPRAMDVEPLVQEDAQPSPALMDDTPPVQPAVAAQTRLDELETRLEAIEKQLSDMKNDMVGQSDFQALEQRLVNLKASGVKAAKQPRESSRKTPKAGQKSVVSDKPKKAAQTKAVRAPKWVLKSAVNGRAWISEKGSSELRIVSVGDTVPGLGRVKAVEQNALDGRWVVKATKRQLKQ